MTIADEINRLEQLRESGSLTDEEFAQAKQQVLADGGTATYVDASGQIFGINETTWCTLMHLSQLITWSGVGIIAPIVMWALSKDDSEIARRHGARMMNWLISSLIYLAVGGILFVVLIGIPIVIVVAIMGIIFPIIAAVKCNNGEIWSYPLAIRFLPED